MSDWQNWRPPNTSHYRIEKRWFGWTLYRLGHVAPPDPNYSYHFSYERAKRLGEQWVEDGEYR